MKLIIAIFCLVTICHDGISQADSAIINGYNNSRFVFAGKVIGYQSEFRAGKEYFFVEFEMMAIYKGERKYRATIIAKNLEQFEVEHFYLLYCYKNKEKDDDGKRLGYIHFSPNRYIELFENKSNPEPEQLRKYIKSLFMRRVKKPLSEARANCHCGV